MENLERKVNAHLNVQLENVTFSKKRGVIIKLEVLASNANKNECTAREQVWMAKLGTKQFGLNT